MTDVTSIGNQGGSTSTDVKKTQSMGTNDFLMMLIAQLKNQDPMNPLNGNDFASQLAQFSSLEQLTNVNTQLGNLGTSLASMTNAQLVNIIGSEASAKGNTVTVDGPATNAVYRLSGDAQQAVITLYDGRGVPVKTIDTGSQNAGLNSVGWDTTNVTKGTYTFGVAARDGNGNPVPADTMLTGKVSGVSFKEGKPYLSINGQDVAYGDVVAVRKPGN
jgi:flagellar basal-body rod modification protein FlgD